MLLTEFSTKNALSSMNSKDLGLCLILKLATDTDVTVPTFALWVPSQQNQLVTKHLPIYQYNQVSSQSTEIGVSRSNYDSKKLFLVFTVAQLLAIAMLLTPTAPIPQEKK